MDSIAQFSTEMARWLQENYPQLEPIFGVFAVFGRFEVYLVIVTLVYWCLNKRLGATLVYLLTFSYMLNSLFKHLLRDPRPYWLQPEIALSEEPTYGVPSGHVQLTTVLFGTFALYFHKLWIWLVSILIILLMALSRIYLGVHDIEDVIAGIVLGIVALAAFVLWRSYGARWFQNRILGQRLLIATSVPLAFLAIYIIAIILTDPPGSDVPWHSLVEEAEIASFEDFATAISGLLGVSIGLVLERSRVRFMVKGSVGTRILRYLVGLLGLLLIWQGLDILFPDEPLAVALPFRFLRYFLLSLWGVYYAPMLFTRIRLAEINPEQEPSLML